MADTVSIILEYLEKQQFTRAAAELRSEIKRKQSEQQHQVRDRTLPQSVASAPPIQPDATDLDVDVYLRLAQEASAGRLGSSSSTTSQDSGASPFQLSPNSLLPDQSGGQEAFREGSSPKNTVSDAPAAHDNAEGSQHSGGSRSPTSSTEASGVSSSSTSAPQQWERGSLPPPLPMAEPVASSASPTSSAAPPGDSDLPQLRPIRLSHSGSTGARASKLQTLPEEEVATDLEEEVAKPGVPGEEVEKKVETGHAGGGRDVTGPLVIGPAVTTTAEGSSQELPGQAVVVRKTRASAPATAVSATPEASTTHAAAVVSAGGAGTGAATHSASGGGGAQDGEDAQSAISLSTDGAAVASEPPDDSAWDSDTYDDEDDVGYTRQPIEDEEWFLLHEIEYPPDGDGEVEGASEGNKESKEVEKAEEEGVREEKAGEDHAGNAGDGDYEGASPVEVAGPQVIPEDGTFFSGEEKYTQKKRAGESGEGEDHDQDHGEPAPGPDGQGEWSGVFSSGRKRADGKGGGEGREGEEEEEDEQMFADSRSVGVMSSDMADAGSSIRESLVGSEGDADSVKGLNIGGNTVQQGATPGGRQSGARDGGEGADDEGGEEVESAERPSAGGDGGSKSVSDVYYESGSRRKKQTKKQGGEEKAETDAGGSDADREKEGDEERDENAGGDEEFGFGALGGSGGLGSGEKSARTAPGSGKGTGHPPVSPGGTSSDAGGEGLGEGGLGGGFSFPSPSSHEGGNLSRMGSGRSHFSSTDGLGSDKNFAELPVGEEEAPDVMSAADDTLAAWKRRSASSSPILSPSTAPLRAGSGGNMDLEEQHQRTEETRLTLTTSSSLGAAGARRLSEEAKEQQRAALSKQGKELKPEEAAAAVAAAAAVVAAASEKGREAVNTGDVKDTPHQGEEGKKGLVPAKAQKPSAAPGASASAAAPSGKSDGIAASGGKEVSAKKEESKGAPAPGPVAPAAAAPAAAAAAAGSAEKPKDGPGVQSSKAPVAEAAAAPEVKKAEQSSTAATGAASTSAAATGGESSESKKPSRDIDEFETFYLKIIHRKNRTGFEEEKDFPVVLNSVIAGRYYVTEYLGSAAFSKAIQAHDLHTGLDVCLKIIKNNKDFFDQSLDEVKLLKFVNRNDPADEHHILRLYDYFYHREHLFIICELLRANLYEFQKYNRDSGGEVYFTMPRLQKIARQVLDALKFMHSLGLIHCDLKPENILIKSYSRCEVKVIDLGSSCFETDHLCSYVQSRSYRAPEVILGLPYGPKIDIWSLGCILAELCSGQVLFQNDSLATLLARVVGILGPIDPQLLKRGRERHKFFTRDHMLYERNPETEQLEYLIPKRTTLRHRVPMGDPGFIEFVAYLLHVDPSKRPTAAEALKHPWLSQRYD